jgi:hypothetical protein
MLEIICKVCFGLCFIALTATIWICWQRPDLWIDLNVEFKAYDSQWNFNNQPMEMHIRHDKDKEAVREQNQEQLDSRKRLFDMKFIEDMNADVSFYIILSLFYYTTKYYSSIQSISATTHKKSF